MCSRHTAVFLCVFGRLSARTTSSAVNPINYTTNYIASNTTVEPLEACRDFAIRDHSGLAWTLADCLEVWSEFVDTVPAEEQSRLRLVDVWRDTAMQLREEGKPCFASSKPTADGVGSSTIRLLASWVFAEEMGCDWVTPDWGKRHVDGGNGTSIGIWYCHTTATLQERASSTPDKKPEHRPSCSVVDWLSYFQFGVSSVDMPEEGTTKRIGVSQEYCIPVWPHI